MMTTVMSPDLIDQHLEDPPLSTQTTNMLVKKGGKAQPQRQINLIESL